MSQDLDRIRSPYNFVPLSPRVVFPDWADAHAWDVPFEDGICGTLELELSTHTPLFVRGTRRESFFSMGPDEWAIPGSEIRGLLRNVVEIAGFGKMSRVDPDRYGVRDLHNRALYTDHMAALMTPEGGGPTRPLPLVDAGWLRRTSAAGEPVSAEIEPCDYAKIHYRDLIELARKRSLQNFRPGRRQSAPDKYKAWGAPNGEEAPRRVSVDVEWLRPNRGRFRSQFGRARPGGTNKATLVFTGQPASWRESDPRSRAKRHDFVFLEPTPGTHPISVPPEAFSDFEFIHADRGQQNRLVDERAKPNPEWKFWRDVFDHGGRVPIFFLRWPDGHDNAGQLRALGLAMMFRLAYQYTVRDAVKNAQPQADVTTPDLAETIFGTVPRDDSPEQGESVGDPDDAAEASIRTLARRGRVSVGLLRAAEGTKLDSTVKELVLGAPKPSYYPNYIEQGPGHGDAPAPGDRGKHSYQTLMDPGARVRGWKRYRPHEAVPPHPPKPTKADGTAVDLSRVATRFTPVRAGSTFSGRIRVHNLRPIELGAVLWALDFGGEPESFHTLGLARSHGYGRVHLAVRDTALTSNSGAGVDLESCRAAFTAFMEEQLRDLDGGWRESVQIRDLLALARPIPVGSDEGRHMLLRDRQQRNEFEEAKKSGLALAPVGRTQARAPRRHVEQSGERTGRESITKSQRSDANRSQRGGPGQKRPVENPATPAVAPRRTRAGWKGIAGGTKVSAKTVGLTKKGKWQVELIEHEAKGVVGTGDAPPDLDVGATVEVIVTGGGNPTNLVLKWPSRED